MGENPVFHLQSTLGTRSSELVRKVGGKFHLKLTIGLKLIANKYHEGKMKRISKRGMHMFEIAEREANGTNRLAKIVARYRDAWLPQRKRCTWS